MDTLRRQAGFKSYAADVALLYDDTADVAALQQAAESLRAEGLTVQVQRSLPEKAKYRKVMRFAEGEVKTVENDA